MKQEDKDLLLTDLSCRLRYNVKVYTKFYGDYDDEIQEYTFVLNSIDTRYPKNCYWIGGEQLQESGKFNSSTYGFSVDIDDEDQEVKPYLRPLSSMTIEEKIELCTVSWLPEKVHTWEEILNFFKTNIHGFDWFNAHHFDYRGLIEKGLALPAPKGMYTTFKEIKL